MMVAAVIYGVVLQELDVVDQHHIGVVVAARLPPPYSSEIQQPMRDHGRLGQASTYVPGCII